MLLSSDRLNKLKNFSDKYSLDFKNFELLNTAFCHTSYSYENGGDRLSSYERLEFLGDAVLKLIVSDILYKTYEDKTEGQLSEQRAIIISDKTIAGFALRLNFDDLILTGNVSELSKKESVLACAFEALLGAIYLEFDKDGYVRCKKFFEDNFTKEILSIDYINHKAQLQELTQKLNKDLPEYVVLEEKGPPHNKTFVIGAYYENKLIGKGEAKSKKTAEFEAAKEALLTLKKLIKEKTDEG